LFVVVTLSWTGRLIFRLRVPAHLDASLWVRVERLHALSSMNRHAAPAGDEADDGVAGQTDTALG
jgi:hypothetical protein